MRSIYLLLAVSCALATADNLLWNTLDEVSSMLSTINVAIARIENRQRVQEKMLRKTETTLKKNQDEVMMAVNRINTSVHVEMKKLGDGQQNLLDLILQLVRNNYTSPIAGDEQRSASVKVTPTQAPDVATTPTPREVDECGVHEAGDTGVYTVRVSHLPERQVWCDSGYLTFQARTSGLVDFNRPWRDYESGFGSVSTDYWLGLKYLHALTRGRQCELRAAVVVDSASVWNLRRCRSWHLATDCDGTVKHVAASGFHVSSADKQYQIHLKVNSSELNNSWPSTVLTWINGQRFTTHDVDHDDDPTMNCAANSGSRRGGGFWFETCEPMQVNSRNSQKSCADTNSVCAYWRPYVLRSVNLQLRC